MNNAMVVSCAILRVKVVTIVKVMLRPANSVLPARNVIVVVILIVIQDVMTVRPVTEPVRVVTIAKVVI